MKSEARVLADVYQDVRKLTKFYLSKAEAIDPFQEYEVAGKKLNSLYWLTGHLVWAEHFLLVEGLGSSKMDIPWLPRFEIGNSLVQSEELPSLEEIQKTMDQVHNQALKMILSLTDEALEDAANVPMFTRTKRGIIQHAIRHEPCHVGQIGWLCKINGIETV